MPAIADVPGSLLRSAIDAGASHVKPNRAELAEATGMADPVAAARSLAGRGATALASLDAEGLVLVDERRAVAAALDRPLEGNTTGAGDAAVAALAACLAEGEADPHAIAHRCALWSAAAVLHPLAGSIGAPDDPVLAALAERIRTRDLEA
ncbi:PfkB family carbohydrate kinase [Agrococcus sp. TF02-05]|uniref:PfkB family carbohydrate kinase n=1 Tax=Agrococcus sp. TF02-05 TaxID=2815211 RepID=UPI0027DC9C32|nr:PfkB family carbohydrate kinase [Agrococcus sp. TF02-05]